MKHYLHKVGLFQSNPALFKAINDLARDSDFKLKWNLEEMTDFFMNHEYLKFDRPIEER